MVVSVPPPPSSRSHRGAMVAAILLAPLLAFGGLELGAMGALTHAQGLAHDLRDKGQFDEAVAVDRVIGERSGDLVFLARGVIDGAPDDAGRIVLAWAADLDRHGHAEQALALLENARTLAGVALPEPDADREHATIALRSARAEATAGRWAVALQRLDQLRDGNPPKDLAAQGEALRPGYALQAARVLLDGGHGSAAVAALDDVVSLTRSGPEAPQAHALLPRALLTAGQQALDIHDQAQALQYLQRLVTEFGSTSQARAARVLLRAPQSVTGTVVRGSTPVSGLEIRLGSHFRQIGNAYQTSSPYFYATTDSRGDFTVSDVPVGGPYVVELLENGSWTTTVGPDGPAYQFSVQPLTPVDLAFVVLPS